jgi:hypothetical protein
VYITGGSFDSAVLEYPELARFLKIFCFKKKTWVF